MENGDRMAGRHEQALIRVLHREGEPPVLDPPSVHEEADVLPSRAGDMRRPHEPVDKDVASRSLVPHLQHRRRRFRTVYVHESIAWVAASRRLQRRPAIDGQSEADLRIC